MKVSLKNRSLLFFNSLKVELKTPNYEFKTIFIKCLILAGLIFASMFWVGFSYLALLMAILFTGFQLNGRSLYYLVFLMPLMQIFRANPSDSYFLIYIVCLTIVVLGIKLLIDVIKKQKKLNCFFTIVFGILCLYFTIRMQSLRFWGSLMLGVFVLFIAYYYKEDLSLKELVFTFAASILITCFIGFFRDCSRLPSFVDEFYWYLPRFCGASINPNVLMGESLFCIALIGLLYLRNEIKYLVYPLLPLFICIIMSTMSKVGFISSVVVLAFFVLAVLFTKLSKKSLFRALACLLVILIGYGICYKQVNACFNRIQDSVIENPAVGAQNPEDTYVDQENVVIGDLNLTNFTTGRIDIWISYLHKITESPTTLIFGYGVGAPFIGEWQGWSGWTPHNTFIQCLYYVGILGVLLIVLWFISMLKKEDYKRFNWQCLMPLIALGLYLCDLEFFSFRLGIYLILFFFGMGKERPNEIQERTQELNVNKIPKTIHYIWLGRKPLPPVAIKCIESWKKYCPDYEIKRWDESNLNIDINKYCRQAYDSNKFAFASDVLRFDVLHREGGVYLDIDVELIKNIDTLLSNEIFMGFEASNSVNPGLILGATKGNKHLEILLKNYSKREFIVNGNPDTTTICTTATEYLKNIGLESDDRTQKVNDVMVYSTQYFCPLSPITWQKNITKETYAIHLYNASWYSTKDRIKKIIKMTLNFVTNGYFGIAFHYLKKKGA